MGCAASRLDDNPAVALCRDRYNFIADALHHSYALADAHLAYSQSLTTIAPTLLRFFSQISAEASPPPAASPDRSSSGSHIRFNSGSEEEDRDNDTGSSDRIRCDHLSSVSSNDRNCEYSHFSNGSFPAQPAYGASSPPPPPAPTSSAWDFLNFFETFEKFEMAHDIPSGELKEAKDWEGPIRDAEEKLEQNEKKKEEEKVPVKIEPSAKNAKNSAPEHQIAISQVMKEVQIQFEKAAKSGDQVLELLDLGRFRYQHQNLVYEVSSKVLPEVSSESAEKIASDLWGLDNDKGMVHSANLSAILKKLCMWEKKLYDEVKAEEKLRLIHEKKSRQLKHLNEKGAEAAHKVDEIRTIVRTICTKRKIAFQIVDKLSITICKVRDEELWPWIIKLIQELSVMWKNMLECQRCQHLVVAEATKLDTIASDVKLDDASLEATMQLRLQIRKWILSFSNWIDVQRSFIKALNGWLLKCLLYEPEETADGEVPFSPVRIGAPRVFVICDYWSQAIDRLSENEVIEAMEGFFSGVNQLVERYNKELQERVVADKDMERKMKVLEREEQKMQKILQAREKKRGVLSSTVHHSELSDTSNLHLGLRQSFSAMESFAAKSVQAYAELLSVGFEEKAHAKENPKLHEINVLFLFL